MAFKLSDWNDILNRIATDNLAKQISCSWNFSINTNTEQIFLQYIAQGQSFFLASGDSGAFGGAVPASTRSNERCSGARPSTTSKRAARCSSRARTPRRSSATPRV